MRNKNYRNYLDKKSNDLGLPYIKKMTPMALSQKGDSRE
jgi:hypothetical protein